MHSMKLEALMHKSCIKVLRIDICTSMISLSKIAGLKATMKWGGKNLKRRRLGNIGEGDSS